MTNFQKKFATAIATSALLLNVVAPLAHADTTLEISGNGNDSYNKVEVKKDNDVNVVQNNNAVVINKVESNASTGGNEANKNTGGDVKVSTGDATSKTTVSNDLNKNAAQVNACDCEGDTTVKVAGNGNDSTNKVELKSYNDTNVYQDNKAFVKNDVDAKSSTGKNEANKNTGGDVKIETGNAKTDVSVSTTANVNSAKVGSGNGQGNGSSASIMILDNGNDTYNKVELKLDHDVMISQDNDAKVKNYIDADAFTGKNEANKNTGGDVSIDTGDAETHVDVDNMVNFNMAEVGCDCEMDVTAKVAGNGDESKNKIEAKLGGDTNVFQGDKEGAGNKAFIKNDVDGNAKTGHNEADKNTSHDGDPSIETGNAKSNTEVNTSGNVNVFGPIADVELPGVNMDLHLSFDLSDLLEYLGII